MRIMRGEPRKSEPLRGRKERAGTNDREQANSQSSRASVSKTSKGLSTSMDPSSLAILRDILHPLQNW
ncbi:hypothetical protein Bca4012_089248 [Brassica carinata]